MSHFRGMRFGGRPIDRAAAGGVRKDSKRMGEIQRSPLARFLVGHSTVNGKEGAAILFTASELPRLVWWTRDEVRAVSEQAESEAIYLGPVLEGGPSVAAGTVEAFAVDFTKCLSDDFAKLKASERQERWTTGRELLVNASVPDADVTMAGMVFALTAWSQKARFDPASGNPTDPIEGGVKRQERGGRGRTYPRTDPAAIGLVVSPDGQRLLLQAPERPGFTKLYTCVSGFVDPCETVEEAFRREVFEEVGITMSSVELVASQAWPIGRAGSCELMIGCRGQATSQAAPRPMAGEIHDARWFSREEVLQLMAGTHPEGIKVPGDYALAYHLIKSWVDSTPASPLGAQLQACFAKAAPALFLAACAAAALRVCSKM